MLINKLLDAPSALHPRSAHYPSIESLREGCPTFPPSRLASARLRAAPC